MAKPKPKRHRMTKALKSFAATLTNTQNFTVKDFKRHCIVREMPFEEVAKQDVHEMRMFIFRHKGLIKPELLDDFDIWNEKYLREERNLPDVYFHPLLRMGFVGEEDEDGNIKRKRVKGIKKAKKAKRERNEHGIFSGTKKALTFKCAADGKTIKETIDAVLEVFSDAKEKSISIWFKKAIKMAKTT